MRFGGIEVSSEQLYDVSVQFDARQSFCVVAVQAYYLSSPCSLSVSRNSPSIQSWRLHCWPHVLATHELARRSSGELRERKREIEKYF
jgi:hypothetical protein